MQAHTSTCCFRRAWVVSRTTQRCRYSHELTTSTVHRKNHSLCGIHSHVPRFICRAVEEELEQTDEAEKSSQNGTAPVSSSDEQTTEASSNGSTLIPGMEAWRWEESNDALRAYGALMGVLGLGLTPFLHSIEFGELFYFLGLATLTIYIGAHRSLGAKQRQQLSFKEGALAPIFASCILFGGYLLIKFFPSLSLQGIINIYFGLLGTGAVFGAAAPILRRLPFADAFKFNVPTWLLVDEDGSQAEAWGTDALAFLGALAVVAADVLLGHKNFTLNNVLACLIAADILQLLGVRSFRTAAILLTGLLLYDVFWVFGSPKVVGDNVMMTVATSNFIEGPFKLLFPRELGRIGEGGNFPYSLLGLGDVAVPGFLACLALRYDASRCIDMKARAVASASAMQDALDALDPAAETREIMDTAQSAAESAYDDIADKQVAQRDSSQNGTSTPESSFSPVSDVILSSRTYFNPILASYAVGLLLAFGANYVTRLGQPALLYLVPCTLGTLSLRAFSRKELLKIWRFTDAPSFDPLKASADKQEGSS